MSKKIIDVINCLIFFDEKLFKCSKFLQTVLNYSKDVLFIVKMIRLLSKFIVFVLISLFMKQHQASKIFVSYLMSMMKKQLKKNSCTNKNSNVKFIDVIQFFIEANVRKNA